jgi:uncharacterized protein (DUF983 family)
VCGLLEVPDQPIHGNGDGDDGYDDDDSTVILLMVIIIMLIIVILVMIMVMMGASPCVWAAPSSRRAWILLVYFRALLSSGMSEDRIIF